MTISQYIKGFIRIVKRNYWSHPRVRGTSNPPGCPKGVDKTKRRKKLTERDHFAIVFFKESFPPAERVLTVNLKQATFKDEMGTLSR